MAKTTTKAAPKKAAPKKKVEEAVEAKAPVDYSKYDYRPTDELVVKAAAIGQLRQALNTAVQGGTKDEFPSVLTYVQRNTGIEVENPSPKAIQEGQVAPMLSLEKTFAQDNIRVSYEPWVGAIVQALQLINEIHAENVDAGRATERQVLIKEAEEAQKKAQEEAKKQAEAQATDPDA